MALLARSALWIILFLVPARAWSQQTSMTRAFALERRATTPRGGSVSSCARRQAR